MLLDEASEVIAIWGLSLSLNLVSSSHSCGFLNPLKASGPDNIPFSWVEFFQKFQDPDVADRDLWHRWIWTGFWVRQVVDVFSGKD